MNEGERVGKGEKERREKSGRGKKREKEKKEKKRERKKDTLNFAGKNCQKRCNNCCQNNIVVRDTPKQRI